MYYGRRGRFAPVIVQHREYKTTVAQNQPDAFTKHNSSSRCCGWSCKLGACIAVLICLVLGLRYLDVRAIVAYYEHMKEHPSQTLPVFFVTNAAAVVLLVPGAVPQMLGGAGVLLKDSYHYATHKQHYNHTFAATSAVYGLRLGFITTWAATFVGQCCAFLLGRHFAREALAAYLLKYYPTFPAIEAAIFKDGWKLVLLLRLSPVLPDSIVNYALALTSIGFDLFAAATATTLVPWTVLYVYLGSASTNIAQTIKGGEYGDAKLKMTVSLASLILFVVLAAYMTMVFRRAIQSATLEKDRQSSDNVLLLADGSSSKAQVMHHGAGSATFP